MIRIRKSAYKHGLTKPDIQHAVTFAIRIMSLNDEREPSKILIIGPDTRGQLIEIIAANETTGEITVIHAMLLRKKFHHLITRGNKND